MHQTIRKMKEEDRVAVLEMMRVFYASPTVHVYKKCGYEILPYTEMKKEAKE